MAKNIEIKAHATDFSEQHKIADELSHTSAQTLIQKDTFFHVEQGRLKLRQFPDASAQLIFYQRNNTDGPKLSDYHISETEDGEGLKSVLEKAYGIRHIVKKVRTLYLVGQTRIHLDLVEGLGEFIELEVVLTENQSTQDGERTALSLMQKLGIDSQNLVDLAYVDLLESAA